MKSRISDSIAQASHAILAFPEYRLLRSLTQDYTLPPLRLVEAHYLG
jgi:hypothetical protein